MYNLYSPFTFTPSPLTLDKSVSQINVMQCKRALTKEDTNTKNTHTRVHVHTHTHTRHTH